MANKRNTYDTLVILLFILRQEDLLPAEFVAQIPYSTRCGWRDQSEKKFIGSQFRDEFMPELRRSGLFRKYKHLKKVLYAVQNIYTALADFFELVRIKLHDMKEYREKVCDVISEFSSVLSAEKIRGLFHISQATHQRWLFEIKSRCSESFSGFCFKTHPNQLSRPEIATIKKFLTDPAFFHWPVCSIAWYCAREGILSVSVATWYRYRKLLGIVRKRFRRPAKKEGLKSSCPNEFWHLDVTKIQTSDLVWHYVYMLKDNFSKKILAWRLATKLSMNISKDVIGEAYVLAKEIEHPVNVSLVVDDGRENQNSVVDNFILSTTGKINKLTALKDICFSNSAIEATFRTLKSFYLRPEDLQNTSTLETRLKFMVSDFCSVRPNGDLKGFTPDEVYFDAKPEHHFSDRIREATAIRREFNRNDSCGKCKVKMVQQE